MDLPVRAPQATCAITARPFAPGEVIHSSLVRGDDGLARVDVSAGAWVGPPPGALATWRSIYPSAGSPGPVLAPVDVLLDALEQLGDDPAEVPVRYLLALHLVRRRVLRVVDARPPDHADGLLLACRRRDRDYHVAAIDARAAATSAVADRLAALLWSGDAA